MAGRKKKFIQKAIKRPGALRKELGIKEGEKIPAKEITSKIRTLRKKAKGEKKLSSGQSRMLKQLILAKTLKGLSRRRKKRSLMSKEGE